MIVKVEMTKTLAFWSHFSHWLGMGFIFGSLVVLFDVAVSWDFTAIPEITSQLQRLQIIGLTEIVFAVIGTIGGLLNLRRHVVR